MLHVMLLEGYRVLHRIVAERMTWEGLRSEHSDGTGLHPDAFAIRIAYRPARRCGVCCSWCGEPCQKAGVRTCLVDERQASCMAGPGTSPSSREQHELPCSSIWRLNFDGSCFS